MASSTIIKERKSTVRRLDKNSRIFKTILRAIQDKKGEKIISIDLRKIPEAVADYFILCEAGSTPQLKAIADAVEDHVLDEIEEKPFEKEGYSSLQWIILDYVNVVVHIFRPETRQFYNLEEMWSDALQEEHES